MDRPGDTEDIESATAELILLAETAGAEIIAQLIQKRAAPDQAYYTGPGKARELADMVRQLKAPLVVYMGELSPSQVRHLEQLLEAKVVDRTALILDIFASRARSREGKLQVELAQLQYLLPRLVGLGKQMSRLGGGIGTRGPGETKLEADRRVIRKRIAVLEQEIKDLQRHRKIYRLRRRRNGLPIAGLVGYTNAGKSKLINALTGADLYTEDKLFATLDPSTRRGTLPGGKSVLYTDTVGFIKYLPETLETAFRATLEEIAAADLLLHVVDLNHPDYENQISVVRNHLARITAEYFTRELLVFNKTDLLEEDLDLSRLKRQYPGSCFISARTGDGIDNLRQKVAEMLEWGCPQIKIYLPYTESALLNRLRKFGQIISLEYQESCIAIETRVEPALADKLYNFTAPPERIHI